MTPHSNADDGEDPIGVVVVAVPKSSPWPAMVWMKCAMHLMSRAALSPTRLRANAVANAAGTREKAARPGGRDGTRAARARCRYDRPGAYCSSNGKLVPADAYEPAAHTDVSERTDIPLKALADPVVGAVSTCQAEPFQRSITGWETPPWT